MTVGELHYQGAIGSTTVSIQDTSQCCGDKHTCRYGSVPASFVKSTFAAYLSPFRPILAISKFTGAWYEVY